MPTISFREAGSGPPIVFLHGFCEMGEIWDEFVKPLEKEFRVLLPDLPGFGRSQLLPGQFTIDEVAAKILDWLQDLGIKSAIFVGHSLGGYVALALADSAPAIVKGFCLFHSTALQDSKEKKENRTRVMRFVETHGALPFVETFVPGLFYDKKNPAIPIVFEIAAKANASAIISYSHAMRERADRMELLQKSKIPKLIIAGVEDSLIPIETVREMAKTARNSTFLELVKTGHMGLFEARNECRMATTRFAYSLLSNN
jgi:pimeloyl-ACP methyl ester carboxylesterase